MNTVCTSVLFTLTFEMWILTRTEVCFLARIIICPQSVSLQTADAPQTARLRGRQRCTDSSNVLTLQMSLMPLNKYKQTRRHGYGEGGQTGLHRKNTTESNVSLFWKQLSAGKPITNHQSASRAFIYNPLERSLMNMLLSHLFDPYATEMWKHSLSDVLALLLSAPLTSLVKSHSVQMLKEFKSSLAVLKQWDRATQVTQIYKMSTSETFSHCCP